ncbi:MAG: efflux RND transporter periplasmic adaptor subunit [Alphaproteobacteria bacterium]
MSIVKQVGILAVIVALLGGGYAGWQAYSASNAAPSGSPRGGGGGPAVETVRATIADLETTVEAVGSTRAHRAVEITPSASGRVTEVNVQAGRRVDAKDILLRLDDDIERANLIEAEAQLTEARSALKRARELMKSSATSQAAVEKLEVALATAQAERDRAARRLRDRIVVAPFDGVVGFTNIETGSRVEAGQNIASLDDLSLIEIDFSIPENLFGRIKTGQRVLADATAFPGRVFEGRIERIDSRIDPVSRAFRARAVAPNPDYELPAGMFMHLAVVLDNRKALTVPEEAIFIEGSQPAVFVVRDGERGTIAERRDITIGQRGFGNVEILDGISDGEEVIVRGVQKARDGRPVRRAKPAGTGRVSG